VRGHGARNRRNTGRQGDWRCRPPAPRRQCAGRLTSYCRARAVTSMLVKTKFQCKYGQKPTLAGARPSSRRLATPVRLLSPPSLIMASVYWFDAAKGRQTRGLGPYGSRVLTRNPLGLTKAAEHLVRGQWTLNKRPGDAPEHAFHAQHCATLALRHVKAYAAFTVRAVHLSGPWTVWHVG
jgi:hypothetical protein